MAHGTRMGRIALSVLGIVVLLAGCATNKSGQAKEARRAVTSMHKTRQELVKAQVQVDDMVGAMSQLASAAPDKLASAYRVFNRQLSQTVKQADAARGRANEMRERWRDYIDNWEKEAERLSTPGLQANAAERRQAVEKNYDRLRDAAHAMDQAYQPFLTHLRDIQKALSLDLTPAGIQATQPAFESARASAVELKQKIADFMAQIDQVQAVSPPQT
jgi:chromosome segregation ATPase